MTHNVIHFKSDINQITIRVLSWLGFLPEVSTKTPYKPNVPANFAKLTYKFPNLESVSDTGYLYR